MGEGIPVLQEVIEEKELVMVIEASLPPEKDVNRFVGR